MTREEAAHIVDVAFHVPLAARMIGEDRTYQENEIREAKDMAIQALAKEPYVKPITEDAIKTIQGLMIACTPDSKYYRVGQMAIQALTQEPCEDAISRQAVLDCQRRIYDETGEELDIIHAESVLNLPSVNPSRRKGHWIAIKRGYLETPRFECSECHTQEFVETCMYKPIWNFCPNCGTKMVGPQAEGSDE